MTRKCFLVDQRDLSAGRVTLGDDVAHHVRAVLRLRAGDSIELRDGQGNAWDAVLTEMAGREVRVAVVAKKFVQQESALQLTLALAFSRADRMELAVRQATEMGVHRFIAFPAVRSEYRLSGSRMAKREERWRRIAREALCQCGRTSLPQIQICANAEEFLSASSEALISEREGLKILAREDADRLSLLSLHARYPECQKMLVAVGPEGGWSQPEGDHFLRAGFHPVHLGPRTLRLETATLALLAAVQLLWGDLGTRCDRAKDEVPYLKQKDRS
jgi:16S rRNA (uracil1498-N3)-methyltransferase